MANITQLLAAISNLPPVPNVAPVGPLTPPTFPTPEPDFMTPMPEPPPAAPSMPLNRSIIEEYLSLLGPAPQAPPAPAPIGGLERIALALQAFGAGFQGQGPQFLQSVRAERERPQREFEARTDEYNQRRQQFGLRGLEAARDIEDKRQSRQQQTADRQFELEVKERARQLGLKDEREMALFRDSLLAKRQREDDERQFERQQQAQRAQQERDARTFASAYRKAGAGRFAKELADYDAGLTEALSPAAAKWESAQVKLQEIRAARVARMGTGGGKGGGSAAAQKALQQFEEAKAAVADAMARGDSGGEQLARKRMNATLTTLSRFPAQVQVDFSGQLPVARVKTGKPAATPAPYDPRIASGEVEGPQVGVAPAAPSMNRAQSKAKLVKNGYTPKEADAELDRLGIR